MNHPDSEPPRSKPHSLWSTFFLGGGALVMGSILIFTALRDLSANLLALASGVIFFVVGLTVLVRDFSGAENNEEIPATAPAFLRLADSLLTIALLTVLAILASAVAIGPLFSEVFFARYEFGIVLRVFAGAFGLVLWYGVIYILMAKLKRSSGK